MDATARFVRAVASAASRPDRSSPSGTASVVSTRPPPHTAPATPAASVTVPRRVGRGAILAAVVTLSATFVFAWLLADAVTPRAAAAAYAQPTAGPPAADACDCAS